ncbi:MAG: hypothetical protein KDK00_01420 [Rhodobacteraceae bacterium]|nr:hypothetical protein [Paracoccaceae bacterium]
MVTSSKILTVTYGTFSCTLEGFDDPFTTLQKVAEYFRKLAAEDRYFGGTPQTPDTETLRRIAEASSPRPINAEVGEQGITLRQSADIAETPPVPFDVGQSEADGAESAEPAATDTEDDTAPVHFFRSRRADHDAEPEFEAAPEPETVCAPDPEPAAEPDDISRAVAGIAAAAGSGAAIRAAAPAKDVEQTLAAIRQNVEQAEHEIEAIGQMQVDADFEDEAEPEILAEAEAEPEVPETIEAEPVEAEADDLFEAQAEVEPDPQDAIAAEAGEEPQMAEAEPIADEAVAVEPEPVVEAVAEAEPVAEVEYDQPEIEAEAEIEVAEMPEPIEPEAEAADTPAEAEMPAEDIAAEAEAEPVRTSSLTEEEEADLARQLAAAMEPDAGIATADAPDDTQWRAERRRRASALRQMAAPTNGNGALDRLLHTAQVQMDHPEQQRRVNALDQLKAAVAATEAEAQLRRKKPDQAGEAEREDAQEMESFRRDFRQVQSHAGLGRLSGGGEHRPASPLILVSEQRIDEPRSDDQPMREVAESHGNLALKPRVVPVEDDDDDEIQGIPSDAFSGAANFEDFVERVGVFEMTELLEAAAAYTSIVEGEDRFSRASVMSKIAMLNHGDGYSKEAGLRAFGKLLREGKILRVQDGQFAISKASRYSVASRYES